MNNANYNDEIVKNRLILIIIILQSMAVAHIHVSVYVHVNIYTCTCKLRPKTDIQLPQLGIEVGTSGARSYNSTAVDIQSTIINT